MRWIDSSQQGGRGGVRLCGDAAAFPPNWVSSSAHPARRQKLSRRGAAATMLPLHTSQQAGFNQSPPPPPSPSHHLRAQIINICCPSCKTTLFFFPFFGSSILAFLFASFCLFPANGLPGDVAQKPPLGLLSKTDHAASSAEIRPRGNNLPTGVL